MTARAIPHLGEPPRVSTQHVTVLFKDGGQAMLHNVITSAGNDRFLHAVPHASGEYLVDVRKLARTLGDELPVARANDRPFLLTQTMRLRFQSLDEFMTAVHHHAVKGLAEV